MKQSTSTKNEAGAPLLTWPSIEEQKEYWETDEEQCYQAEDRGDLRDDGRSDGYGESYAERNT